MGERVCYAQRRQEDGTLGRVRGGHVQTRVYGRGRSRGIFTYSPF